MSRKSKPQVVWNVERDTSETIWSGRATVKLTLRIVGNKDRWYNSRTDVRAVVYNGDSFGGDVKFVVGIGGSKIADMRAELDMIAAFNGRSNEITVDSVLHGLARCDEGFYDSRVESWQPISNATRGVYTPELMWHDDNVEMDSLEDLRNIYADDEEDAQAFVSKALVERGRLDVLKAWGWRGMSVYEQSNYRDMPEATSICGLFDNAPDKLPQPEEEEEPEVELEEVELEPEPEVESEG